ncbi:hypothetical protein RB195_002476 [Necator americanus]|uniref:Uncharacterized protein n=1 Tax=Necator americanus TaxID=51031 RepID=A0ABR1DJ84_NECAM
MRSRHCSESRTLSSNVVRPSVRKFDADDKPSIDDRASLRKTNLSLLISSSSRKYVFLMICISCSSIERVCYCLRES